MLRVDNKFIKGVSINNVRLTGFVDFGSHCTLIKESVIKEIVPREKWQINKLPSLRGFSNTYVNALGKTEVSLVIDNVTILVETIIVPDNYLSYDLFIGQTATEQSHIWVIKSDENLMITDKRIIDNTRLVLRSLMAVTDTNFSGFFFVENGYRPNYNIEIGIHKIKNGNCYLTILNYDKVNQFKLKN